MLQQARTKAGTRTDLVTGLLGTWFTLGLFLDAWAHSNLTELETFFTPWHAVFYSGFAATGAWICWLVYRNHQLGRRGLDAVPLGYGPAVLALPLFAVMGAGDYTWHTLFGIETDIEILFSPTHLGLAVSMMVIVATPLRSAWLDPSRDKPGLPALLSLGFATSLVMLFLQYADATIYPPEMIVQRFSYVQGESNNGVGKLTASIFVTNLVLLAPVLLAARRWTLGFGTATTVQIIVGVLSAAVTAFSNLGMMVALIISGVLVDLLILKLRPNSDRPAQFRLLGLLMPLITWGCYFAGAVIGAGRFPTVTETWTGVPLVAACGGMLLAFLMAPRPIPVNR